MNSILNVLAWSIVLGLIQVLIAGGMVTKQRGLSWNVSNRDGEAKAVTGAAARAQRASNNYLETFVFFAASALAIVIANINSPHALLGARIYFLARLAYFPIYVIGIPYLRTAVYGVSLWGILQLLEPLLKL